MFIAKSPQPNLKLKTSSILQLTIDKGLISINYLDLGGDQTFGLNHDLMRYPHLRFAHFLDLVVDLAPYLDLALDLDLGFDRDLDFDLDFVFDAFTNAFEKQSKKMLELLILIAIVVSTYVLFYLFATASILIVPQVYARFDAAASFSLMQSRCTQANETHLLLIRTLTKCPYHS